MENKYCVKLNKRTASAEELAQAKEAVLEGLRDAHTHLTFADLLQLDVPIGLILAAVASEPGSNPKTWLTPPIIRLLESKSEWYPNSWLSPSLRHNRQRNHSRKIEIPVGLQQIPAYEGRLPIARKAKMTYSKLQEYFDPGDIITVEQVAWVSRSHRTYAKRIVKQFVARGWVTFKNKHYYLV